MEEFQEGYVLHVRPYTDSRILVEWFTKTDGRVTTVARTSQRARTAPYQQFRRFWITYKGKSALKTLLKVESITAPFIDVRSENLRCGFYLNELVIRALPENEPEEAVFAAYEEALQNLFKNDITQESSQSILRKFELHCLECLGFAVDFRYDCDTGKPIRADRSYKFIRHHGFVEGDSPQARDPMTFSGNSLLKIAQRQFDETAVLKDAKRLCRILVTEMIGDKPLKSRDLFR